MQEFYNELSYLRMLIGWSGRGTWTRVRW